MRSTQLLVACTAFVCGAALGASENQGQAQSKSAQTLVGQAQEKLSALGYDPGPANDIQNKKTQEAVKRFQKANKLDQSGQVDQPTLAALQIDQTMTAARSAPRSERISALPSESSSTPSSEPSSTPSSSASQSGESSAQTGESSAQSSESSAEKTAEPTSEQPKS